MVTLTIDGIEVTVERGASILEAAQKAGVRVPTLCNDKRLVPYGACRLCMVEVTARGRTRTMPACFNPARDGMEVTTQSPRLTESRRMELMLLLRSHPLLCPSCDAGGNCRLQELVHEYEVPELPFPAESRHFHVDHASHFIRFNMNLCIKCGMCVRICDEVQGVNELSFVGRGMHCEVSTDFGRPLDCEFCGQCAQVCPVGAIASKWLVGTGRDFELKKTDTVCAFCSLGCVIQPGEKDGKVVWVTSPPDSHNDGNLCVKGRYGWPYVFSTERLTTPLIRKGGTLTPVDWNEALTYVAQRFNRIKSASGAESLAALGSERLTNEEAYVFGRFVRTVLGTPHLDHSGGYGYRGLVDGLMPALGYPASPNSIKELKAADVIVLLGADLYETHPVAKNDVIIASNKREAKIIVIDSIRTKLADRARISLLVPPGCEHLVAYAMLKVVIDEGLFDRAALDLRADGFDDLVASLAPYSADNVAAVAGVDAELIRQAAREYAHASRSMIVVVDGMSQRGRNVLCARAAAGLALVTGRLGKNHAGVCMFGEKTNAQGAIDMGLAPDLLPGYAAVADDAARAKFEAAWGAPIPAGPGMNAAQIVAAAAEGRISGLYVVGENPLDTYPDRELMEKALSKVDCLVVQDMFLTSTAKMAHVVLPVTAFMEKTGTFTSAERRIQRLKPVVKPLAGKSDLEVFSALAAVMGRPAMTYAGLGQVMDEIAGLAIVYGGVSYDRLRDNGICWPCVDPGDPGRRVLYEGGFPNGKAKLLPAPSPSERAGGDLPMYLIMGPLKFHSGSFSEWSSALLEVSPDAVAEMNLADMDRLGVDDGEPVRITGASGESVRIKVKSSRRALPGTVIVPQHFSAMQINRLTSWDSPVVKVRVDKV